MVAAFFCPDLFFSSITKEDKDSFQIYFFNNCFQRNTCYGAFYDIAPSVSGGGGIALMAKNLELSSDVSSTFQPYSDFHSPFLASKKPFLCINFSIFASNIGGGISVMEGINGVIDNDTFYDNHENIQKASEAANSNIECQDSMLKVLFSNLFLNEMKQSQKNYNYYYCDVICNANDLTEIFCMNTGYPELLISETQSISTHQWPVLPPLKFHISTTILTHPAIYVSLSRIDNPPVIKCTSASELKRFQYSNLDPSQFIEAVGTRTRNDGETYLQIETLTPTTLIGFPLVPPSVLYFYVTGTCVKWTNSVEVAVNEDQKLITVKMNGADSAECLKGNDAACRTIFYAISSPQQYVDIKVDKGIFLEDDVLCISKAHSLRIFGSDSESVIGGTKAKRDAIFVVKESEIVTISDLCVQTYEHNAIVIKEKCCSIFLTNIMFTNADQNVAEWFLPISVTDSSLVTITFVKPSHFEYPKSTSSIPYVIKANNVASLVVCGRISETDTFGFSHKGIGLLYGINCDEVNISTVNFFSHSGNKIYLLGGKSITISGISFNPKTTHSHILQFSQKEELYLEKDRSDTFIHKEKNKAKLKLTSTEIRERLIEDEIAYHSSAINIYGSSTCNIDTCTFNQLYSMAVNIDSVKLCSISGCSFENNILADCFASNANIHPDQNSGEGTRGCGCSVTITNIIQKLIGAKLTFKKNKFVDCAFYNLNDEFEHNCCLSDKSKKKGEIKQEKMLNSSINSDSLLKDRRIFADLWISHVGGDAAFSEISFMDNQMLFEHIVSEDEKDKHFIVPKYSSFAPAKINLQHELDSRETANFFAADINGKLNIDYFEASNIEGIVALFLSMQSVFLTNMNFFNVTIQPNSFCESALFVQGDRNKELTFMLTESTGENIHPAQFHTASGSTSISYDNGWYFDSEELGHHHQQPQLVSPSGGGTSGGLFTIVGMREALFRNVLISKTRSNGNGGAFAIFGAQKVNVAQLTANDCSCEGSGGVFLLTGSELDSALFFSCSFSDCFAGINGGAISINLNDKVDKKVTSINITQNCVFERCTAGSGGAINILQKEKISDKTIWFVNEPSTYSMLAVNLTDVKISQCGAFYGGGLYLCSQQYITALHALNLTVSECVSHFTGGGIFFSGINEKIVSGNISNYQEGFYLQMQHCSFKDNQAFGIGGGMYVHASSAKQLTRENNEKDNPSILIYRCEFLNNKCFGSMHDTIHGLAGGGGFTESLDLRSPSSLDGDNPSNTVIEESTFKMNIGGGFSALRGVSASLSHNMFNQNVIELDDSFSSPLNIECFKSNLSLSKNNRFIDDKSNEGTHVSYYSCDQQCESFKGTSVECFKPNKTPILASGSIAANINNYPHISSLKFQIETLQITRPLFAFSTSSTQILPTDPDSLELIMQSNFRKYHSTPQFHNKDTCPSQIYYQKQSGNNSSSVGEKLSEAIQFVECEAKRSAELEPEEAFVYSIGKEIILSEFPKLPPDSVYCYVTGDGIHWSNAIRIDLLNILSEKEKKEWGWISIGILLSFVIIFLVLVGTLSLISRFVEKKRKKPFLPLLSINGYYNIDFDQ
ncbi:uncharacterized protein MONOS_7914 [Monocercomonoides exilis]|uniref:uncharacterized protein n=1 Tax=Monocercomonoides exilis TaxID=2049356 RepID=UPI00355A101C|nr:hypothetical protein MONOS_7914 [Monocercomonoides exilis]|eukprot:MONOS_7914.1-p1 / transcript=MONOS_7914.1 / gene=MONOS_7914 / organism=Monocercomonoides_exilis_PA203 / gene_product=unspecified product / transcript_product=unspecified product / location=Mono_scaffold00284:45654-50585(-) / protein_length=1572 / sequence_SO=supercontig / SO=protein_coding / is_pseudo=false